MCTDEMLGFCRLSVTGGVSEEFGGVVAMAGTGFFSLLSIEPPPWTTDSLPQALLVPLALGDAAALEPAGGVFSDIVE